MKHVFHFLILVLLVSSCKKDTKNQEPQSVSGISGTLYGVPFTSKVVLERYNSFFSMPGYTQQELFAIYISPDANKSCGSAENEFSIRLSVPKKVGRFSAGDTYILVFDPRDPKREDGALFNSEDTIIEITSITEDKITGKVDVKGLDANTAFKGSFESTICR